jgi:hypothetical protein
MHTLKSHNVDPSGDTPPAQNLEFHWMGQHVFGMVTLRYDTTITKLKIANSHRRGLFTLLGPARDPIRLWRFGLHGMH